MTASTFFFDGGLRDNLGAGAAVAYEGEKEVAYKTRIIFGKVTSNQMEYEGLLLAIELARELKADDVTIYGDSELIVRQVDGRYRALNPELVELRDRVWRDATALPLVVIRECPKGRKGKRRDNNQRADLLVNLTLDLRVNLKYNQSTGEVMETHRENMEEEVPEEKGFAEDPMTDPKTPADQPGEPPEPIEETDSEPIEQPDDQAGESQPKP